MHNEIRPGRQSIDKSYTAVVLNSIHTYWQHENSQNRRTVIMTIARSAVINNVSTRSRPVQDVINGRYFWSHIIFVCNTRDVLYVIINAFLI